MQIYLAGNLVKGMMLEQLHRPVAQVILRNFVRAAARLRARPGPFDDTPILEGADLILEGADLVLHLPAGLAHSNFVDSRTRKTFQRAVGYASKIRGMVHHGVVVDWEEFVRACESLSQNVEKLIDG